MNPSLLPCDGEAFVWEDLYSEKDSKEIFQQLFDEIPWKQDVMKIFGKEINLPRLTAWYGDAGAVYSYSGIVNNPMPWTGLLLDIKKKAETLSNEAYNSALVNLYRSGNDSMGWHSDEEASMGKDPAIASVSFGSNRIFQFRHKIENKLKIEVELKNGSLLFMRGKAQHFWKHQLPKSIKQISPRINITFRKIL